MAKAQEKGAVTIDLIRKIESYAWQLSKIEVTFLGLRDMVGAGTNW